MRLLHLASFVPAVLFLGLVVTTFQSTQLSAQSFCGPVTLVNFNGINGQYPAAGVMFDSGGNMYGTTAQGGPSFNPIGNNGVLNYGLGTIWKYSPSAGLTQLFAFSGQKARSRVRDCCWLSGSKETPSPACTINATLDQTVEMLAMRGEKPASEQSSMTLSKTAGEVSRDERTKGSPARS